MRPAGDDLSDHLFIHDLTDHGILAFLCRSIINLLLQRRDRIILQLCCFLVVSVILCLRQLQLRLFELLAVGLDVIEFFLLFLPLRELLSLFFIEVCKFFFDLVLAHHGLRIRLVFQRSLFDLQGHDLPIQLIEVCRHGIHFHSQTCTCFIDQVNGLIRKIPISDIAVAQSSSSHDCFILDLHAMMTLKAFLESSEDRNGILNRRLGNHDLLEPALQCPVLLDVLAVFIKGRCTDALQLASCQHRLQEVRSIHGSFRLACTDQIMNLVDEQDDIAICFLDGIQHALETFLEFATVLGPGNQRPHIQFDELLVLES